MNTIKSSDLKEKRAEGKFSYFLALEKFFSDMPERPRGIIEERYGIRNEEPKTLEEIGKKYRITRERVRQIIKETLKKLKKKRGEKLDEINERIRFTVKEKNDIIKEEELLPENFELKERGALRLFLELFDDISLKEIPGELEKSWATKNFSLSEWRKTINEITEILESGKNPLTSEEILKRIKEAKRLNVEEKAIFDHLEVSSEIKKGSFEKWGLKVWEEISPKGTREKIYLVLKETGKPLHFREISSLIDKYKLNKKKKTHPQTVHNELIRDIRFVLVGRGTYALSEWGYQRGTVKEVLEDILRKNDEPMGREEIIGKTLTIRKVKKSTILINLNNFFQKVGKNQYSIKR
jgi:predicted Zn-ribbon and HTH transcriptional regulator